MAFASATRMITRLPSALAARVIVSRASPTRCWSPAVDPAVNDWYEAHFACLLGLLLFLHGLFELPRKHPLDGDRLDFLSDSFFFEEAIEG